MKNKMKPLLVFSEASPTTRKRNKVKIIIYITIFLLTMTAISYSQSVMEFEAGTSLTNDSGADICADVIHINGTYIGGGTICGRLAYVLNLTVLIEGFYDPFINSIVEDTVISFLRGPIAPYPIVDSAKSVYDSSGIGTFIFNNISNGTNYYIDVRHRNSLETWSAAGQSFASFFMVYNFTNANTQAYGNNMIQVNASPVKFALYNGDVNQDGLIDLADMVLVFNDAANFVTGYVKTDVNGDNLIDLADMLITFNNASAFVSKVTP